MTRGRGIRTGYGLKTCTPSDDEHNTIENQVFTFSYDISIPRTTILKDVFLDLQMEGNILTKRLRLPRAAQKTRVRSNDYISLAYNDIGI